ncbi:MAG: hypothetical protein AAGC68_01845, partial [Verrucomicrobiota bacterium]
GFNGAQFSVGSGAGSEGVVESRPGVGNGDRGAYAAGVQFQEGTIEIELRGSGQPQGSFLGVVFNGVDGTTYESIYFRPFNFGHAEDLRRGHAVQYIAHPQWPWRRLRTERPEEFENPVNPEPDPEDWFRARIEVTDERVRIFVNEGDDASLDVERLSDPVGGKVGVWFNGIAAFRNLIVTPSR